MHQAIHHPSIIPMLGSHITDEYIDIYLAYANKYDYLADLVHNRNSGVTDQNVLK